MRVIESTIPQDQAGLRLDNWLSSRFAYHSRNQWQQEIKAERIKINGRKTKASYKLKTDDLVQYLPLNTEEPEVDKSYSVIYEDDYILAVNKPGNLPCHPAGPFFKNTLWSVMKEKYEDFWMMHRIDRETSGIVLCARTQEVAQKIQKLIRERKIKKEYQLLVHGCMEDEIVANGWLGPDEVSSIRKKRHYFNPTIDLDPEPEWETSETVLSPIKSANGYSLVHVRINTGRLHQIRATSFSLGYPVVGDKIYGLDDNYYVKFINKELDDLDNRALVLERQALHAWRLSFTHPVTNEPVIIEAPVPAEITELVD